MIEEDVVAHDLGGQAELLEAREHVVGDLLFRGRAGDVRLLGERRQPLAARDAGVTVSRKDLFRPCLRLHRARRETDGCWRLSDQKR